MSKSTKDDGWKPGPVSYEEWIRESRRRTELVERIHASTKTIREARGDGTESPVVVTEERWHSLANAFDALVGLLAPEQTKDGCIYCPPLGMSSEELPADGMHRCGYCGKLWRGKALGTGSMWHEVPE